MEIRSSLINPCVVVRSPSFLLNPNFPLCSAQPLVNIPYHPAMGQAAVLLMAIAIALALSPTATGDIGGGRRSRFLAVTAPKNKKCSIDPTVCYGAASPGRRCCGDQCVDTDSDPFNCGKCGKMCKFTRACCDGKCVRLAFDKKNCGSCFNRCKKTCMYGLCDYA
nr:PREDICTED: stigma-specific STIG1-like protein 3 [Musa acuminata subsp. malaccensis]